MNLAAMNDNLITHATRRLDSIPLIVAFSPHIECFMLGTG